MMRSRSSRSGFSLLEMAIAASGTVVLFGLVAVGTQRAFGTWQGTVSGTEVARNANSAMDRMVSVLADAGLTTIADDLAAPTGGSGLSFQVRKGFASNNVVWGPVTSITWASDDGDPRDNVDNDGDGLVDEGQVLMTDENGMTAVLVRNVTEYLDGETANNTDDNGNGLEDEQGLSFELDGNRLRIRLTLSKVGADGQTVTRSAESVVRLLD